MEANKIQVVDSDGNEKEFEVLFTFNNDELNKQYVLYYDASLDEPSVYASAYDDQGQLYPVEDPSEWELIEEVFQSFVGQQDDHECCQNHGKGCCHDDGEHECNHEHHDDQCCCKEKKAN
ncbi:DUF1292 domain-containing protein [Thomasclavelia sp.]|uniref:DUF1292 domain-containing protein n=1 Tax=Thomasclavelia sp. TaxID=3025757 RepID=UPI0025D869B3|nr:DUF1292 domain-containing protein [Thomasclavelia sp.]